MVPLPEFGVLPAGSIRVGEDQGIEFPWVKAIPRNAAGPILNLGGRQHFAQLVHLHPSLGDLQCVLRALVHLLQAQRPGPLADVGSMATMRTRTQQKIFFYETSSRMKKIGV